MGFEIWAHRGSHGAEGPLENTLDAFELAVQEKAHGIELDVHLSRDGHAVVFHDDTLERLSASSDPRAVCDVDWAELQHHHLEGGYTMPSLNEVLGEFQGRIPLNIEIKNRRALDAVVSLLEPHGMRDVLVSSFSWNAIVRAQDVAPQIPRASSHP